MKSLVAALLLLAINSCSSSSNPTRWEWRQEHGIKLDERGFLEFMDVSKTKAREFALQQELLANMLKQSSYNVGPSDVEEGLNLVKSSLLDDVNGFLMDMLTALWNGTQIGLDRVSRHLQPCRELVTFVLDSSSGPLDKKVAAQRFANDLKCMAMLSREVFWYSKADGALLGADLLEAVVHTLTDVIRLHRAAVELDWAAHAAFEENYQGSGIGGRHRNQQSANDPLVGTNDVPMNTNASPSKRKLQDETSYLKMLMRNLMTSLSNSRSPRSIKRSPPRGRRSTGFDPEALGELLGAIRRAISRGQESSTSEDERSMWERSGSSSGYSGASEASGLGRNSQTSSVNEHRSNLAKKNYLKKLLGRLLSRSSAEQVVSNYSTEMPYIPPSEAQTTEAPAPAPTTTAEETYTTIYRGFLQKSDRDILQEKIDQLEGILRYLYRVIDDQETVSGILVDGVFTVAVGELNCWLYQVSTGHTRICLGNEILSK